MKNAWLGSVAGVVLGGAAVWGYLEYSGQLTATATVQQPKTTQQSPESKKSSFLSQDLVEARLKELNFKEVMRLFYKDNMRNVFVNEGEIETENFVAIGSKLTTVLGRVSMDMIAIDVTGLDVELGTQVELWGKHRLVDDVAAANGTIGYELLCRLSQRPKRQLLY